LTGRRSNQTELRRLGGESGIRTHAGFTRARLAGECITALPPLQVLFRVRRMQLGVAAMSAERFVVDRDAVDAVQSFNFLDYESLPLKVWVVHLEAA
jgi:hypothetical protein